MFLNITIGLGEILIISTILASGIISKLLFPKQGKKRLKVDKK